MFSTTTVFINVRGIQETHKTSCSEIVVCRVTLFSKINGLVLSSLHKVPTRNNTPSSYQLKLHQSQYVHKSGNTFAIIITLLQQ